jgi:hypothetical protein
MRRRNKCVFGFGSKVLSYTHVYPFSFFLSLIYLDIETEIERDRDRKRQRDITHVNMRRDKRVRHFRFQYYFKAIAPVKKRTIKRIFAYAKQ